MAVVRSLVVIALCLLGCGKKHEQSGPPPEVTGLAAVPASAEVIIGADVTKLADSPIVERMIEALMQRDGKLVASWKQVKEGCKIDVVKQVKHITLVLGPTPAGGRAGTGPALMIATGQLPETDLSECVGKLVGKGGGAVTGKPINGRTLYEVKEGARAMYFAYGRADTVVLGNTEAYVLEAINPGQKATDHPELSAWLKQVDQRLPLWAVGRVDARVRKGLVGVLPGLKSGPTAFLGTLDPTDGAKVMLAAIMASNEDASSLESFTITQKKVMAMAAQRMSLAKVVNKVSIQTSGSVVYFRAPLDMADVNQLLSVLDGGGGAKQDAPPSAGSGSAAQ